MCNGMVERLNSTLLQMLRSLEETCKSRWKDEIDKLIYAYNCTRHTVTGYSPYYLLFGRKPRLPLDFILRDQNEIEAEDRNYNEYAKIWKERMNEAYKIANQNTSQRRLHDKEYKDLKSTLEPLEVGDRVLVRNLTPRGGTGKLNTFWEQAVYVIKEKKDTDGLVYSVVEQGKPNAKIRTLHRNNLMSCHNFPISFTDNVRNTQNKYSNSPLKNRTRKNIKNTIDPFQSSNSSSDEENELVRNLGYIKGIGTGGNRSRRITSQDGRDKETDDKDRKTQEERNRRERTLNTAEVLEDDEGYKEVENQRRSTDGSRRIVKAIEVTDKQQKDSREAEHERGSADGSRRIVKVIELTDEQQEDSRDGSETMSTKVHDVRGAGSQSTRNIEMSNQKHKRGRAKPDSVKDQNNVVDGEAVATERKTYNLRRRAKHDSVKDQNNVVEGEAVTTDLDFQMINSITANNQEEYLHGYQLADNQSNLHMHWGGWNYPSNSPHNLCHNSYFLGTASAHQYFPVAYNQQYVKAFQYPAAVNQSTTGNCIYYPYGVSN